MQVWWSLFSGLTDTQAQREKLDSLYHLARAAQRVSFRNNFFLLDNFSFLFLSVLFCLFVFLNTSKRGFPVREKKNPKNLVPFKRSQAEGKRASGPSGKH